MGLPGYTISGYFHLCPSLLPFHPRPSYPWHPQQSQSLQCIQSPYRAPPTHPDQFWINQPKNFAILPSPVGHTGVGPPGRVVKHNGAGALTRVPVSLYNCGSPPGTSPAPHGGTGQAPWSPEQKDQGLMYEVVWAYSEALADPVHHILSPLGPPVGGGHGKEDDLGTGGAKSQTTGPPPRSHGRISSCWGI